MVPPRLAELGLSGAAYAVRVADGHGEGFNGDDLVSPASVMKIQIALAVENAIASGQLDGAALRILSPERRTPGPVGISLMRNEVTMSISDLVVAMLTISDNVATDELLDVVGIDEVNRVTRELGLEHTLITSSLQGALDDLAGEAGFRDYAALTAYEPGDGGPTEEELDATVHASAVLNPARGTRTTAAETVRLLQAIWKDEAGPAEACRRVRWSMARQLTRDRIASAFAAPASVAAKSGGLLGVVRNEAAVVTFPGGDAYAVAVFTRRRADSRVDPGTVNRTIGEIARDLISRLRGA